ncbi:DUF6376 family protein [Fictibacillus fluitans]|uniref:DUF6376 family protein n=1 Tax=Fictibacillus fluitans TaxID=3058422 RepID=A0ABT8HYM8_9BACL|nr:DUF6376 family protein [Fictibacillus sp. NE201]MDN4525877.1 DUF6376 family protein [Fictibacillus sp. NE201]
MHIKKIGLILGLLALTGCSAVTDTANTVNYVKEAKEFAGEVSSFSSDTTGLVRDAVNDETKRKELETQLKQMKSDVKEFTGLTPPESLQELHGQMESKAKSLEGGIDLYLKNIREGKLDTSFIEDHPLMKQVSDINKIYEDIKSLGN